MENFDLYANNSMLFSQLLSQNVYLFSYVQNCSVALLETAFCFHWHKLKWLAASVNKTWNYHTNGNISCSNDESPAGFATH